MNPIYKGVPLTNKFMPKIRRLKARVPFVRKQEGIYQNMSELINKTREQANASKEMIGYRAVNNRNFLLY